MTIIELEQAANALGYTLVPQDIHDGLMDVALQHEELRADLSVVIAGHRV